MIREEIPFGYIVPSAHFVKISNDYFDFDSWHYYGYHYLIYNLMSILDNSMKLYVDFPGYLSSEELFESGHRPDLVLETSDTYFVMELMISFETNLITSREYKLNRYKDLKNDLRQKNKRFSLICVEFSSLGFHTKEIKPFVNLLKQYKLNHSRILDKWAETCIRASYFIFNRRNKNWPLPELLLFY